MYEYKAKIISVYDGDTCIAEIDLGFNFKFTQPIRLLRINAPEVRGITRTEGLKSRDRLRKLILNKTVTIQTIKDSKEKYGRYLGEIYLMIGETKVNVNDLMVEKKLAVYVEYKVVNYKLK